MRKARTHKVQMSALQSAKRLLDSIKRISLPMPRLQRHRGKNRNTKHTQQTDTLMASEHRRRYSRASVDSQVGHIWHASENPPRMAELLRKHTLRTKADAKVQQTKEERYARDLKLTEWIKRDGYDIFVAFLKNIEGDAYFKLRNPSPEQNESIERFMGRQAGRLDVIEDIRLMFMDARVKLDEYLEMKKKEQHDTTTS